VLAVGAQSATTDDVLVAGRLAHTPTGNVPVKLLTFSDTHFNEDDADNSFGKLPWKMLSARSSTTRLVSKPIIVLIVPENWHPAFFIHRLGSLFWFVCFGLSSSSSSYTMQFPRFLNYHTHVA
jgi:hypothetical protein